MMDQQQIFQHHQQSRSNAMAPSSNSGTSSPTYLNLGEPQPSSQEDMEHFVSSLLNDSGDSTGPATPGPATLQLLGSQPMDSSFQSISPLVSLDQGIGVESSSGVPTSSLKDGWMKYPMPSDKKPNIKAFDNQRMFSGAGPRITPPECSSYADVARGSSFSTGQANISSRVPARNANAPCHQLKMVFENFVELGKPTIQVPGDQRSSRSFPSPQDFGGNSFDNNRFGSHHNIPNNSKFHGMANQGFLGSQNGYKLERGSGDVGFNTFLMQQNNGFHKMDLQLPPYSGGPFRDSNDQQLHGRKYASDIQQLHLYGPRNPLSQNMPPHQNISVAPNGPFGNLSQVYQAYGHNKPVLPLCKSSSNALLHQASGMTGLPPMLRKELQNSAPIHAPGFTTNAVNHMDQVGVTLEGSLNGCFSELQSLERERKKYEFDLSQQFMGKRITSSNGIAVTPLPAEPLPVDRLICDMYKEYNRIITLTSKIGGLTREGLAAKVEEKLDQWSECIQKVEGHRKAELSHTLRKLSAESVKQLYSRGNNLIAKLSALFDSTREVRTALWLATLQASRAAAPCSENDH